MAIELFDLALAHGITLSCRAIGARNAPRRVVLLHGFPEGAFVWDEVMQRVGGAVAGDVRCVAPNLRGYECSSAPAEVEAYRAKHQVADIAALIEALGAPIDLLVAHDWGGAAAWNLAAQRPHLIERLLIVNSPHPATYLRELRDNPAQQAASAYMNFLCRPDAAALLEERRVRDDRSLPPDILLPGARHNHDVKCLAVGQALRSVPHSLINLSANEGPRPWICVRSTPRTP